MKYQRILLKLSGESLAGNEGHGIDPDRLAEYADEIIAVQSAGTQVGVVIGGGNIFRGLKGTAQGFDRVQGDYMGMLATIINCMALQNMLESKGVKAKVLSGLSIDPVCERMSARRAKDYLKEGYVVMMAGGTGNPFFTTDTACVLRAVEISADVVLKGTRVDGVYSEDPEKNPGAVRFEQLTFEEALSKKLNVMDLTAFTLCSENRMPMIVFDMNTKGNLKKVVQGEKIGTLIHF